MPTPTASITLAAKIHRRFAAARFLTFSALVHLLLVIFGGGVVIVQQYVAEPEDFQSSGEVGYAEVPSTEPPEPSPEPSLHLDPAPIQAPVASMPLNHVITSATSVSAFSAAVPAVASLSRNALTDAIGSATKGLPGKLGTPGLGMPGGTSRNPFGMKKAEAGALKGTFYDLKQTRGGRPTEVNPQQYGETVLRFVEGGWRESVLADYFRSPRALYTTQVMIPNMSATEGPKAFGLEKKVQPSRWLVHYQGRVSPPRSGTYHFVGGGDDILMVRFNRKLVLERNWSAHSGWKSARDYDYGFSRIPKGFAKGTAIQVRAGEWYDMEVLIGEQPGGLVFACLLMEEEGADYEHDTKGNPILPVFRLAAGPMPELEEGQTLPPHLAEGPVWKAEAGQEKRSALDLMVGQE